VQVGDLDVGRHALERRHRGAGRPSGPDAGLGILHHQAPPWIGAELAGGHSRAQLNQARSTAASESTSVPSMSSRTARTQLRSISPPP
jgi:hypothetical protein